MRLFDAHNHLQDDRFAGRQDELVATAVRAGVERMLVNGTCQADWPLVADLHRQHSQVLPSFGCHPWYLGNRTPRWREELIRWLDLTPDAVIGEIGLDRWMLENPERWRQQISRRAAIRAAAVSSRSEALGFSETLGVESAAAARMAARQPPSLTEQENAFLWQLALATERNLPVSLHCLQAFGRLHELLSKHPRPARGFLLHSYGGPVELVAPFAQLGAYFGFPGYFAHERKARQRETFRAVPTDRLLIETDAPDQLLPDALNEHPLTDPATGLTLNHPANLAAVYRFLAGCLGEPVESLAARVETNFTRLFGAAQQA